MRRSAWTICVAVVCVEGSAEASGCANHGRCRTHGHAVAKATNRSPLGHIHRGRSRTMGGDIRATGKAARSLVPAVRVGLGLGVATGAGGRRRSTLELGGSWNPVAGLAVEEIRLGRDAVEGGIGGPGILGVGPGHTKEMRRAGTGVAEGGVVAAGLGPCGRGRSGMPDRVAGGTKIVALGAHSGVGRVGGGMGEDRAAGGSPGFGGMRCLHPMAGDTGIGGKATGKVLAMADLAGHEASAIGEGWQLRAHAVDARIRPARYGLVVATGGHAGGDAAAHPEHGDLMALGAAIHSCHGLPAVGVDPAGRMVVPVVLDNPSSALAVPTIDKDQGGEGAAKDTQETGRPDPIPSPVHGDTQERQAARD